LIAEIYKNDEWHELVWIQGDDPLVVIEVEQDTLFNFVSSYAQLLIFDRDGYFRPGGDMEIVRGDIVRIKGGSQQTEIFRGFVDREQSWNYENELLRFRVLSYSQELKDLKIGKRGNVVNADGEMESVSGLRYLKRLQIPRIVNDEEIQEDWLQVIWEHIYPTLTPADRLGYDEVYLYDSRGLPFQPENDQDAYEEVQWGVYRWRNSDSLMRQINLSDIARDVVRQLNLEYGDYELIYSPGTISRYSNLRIIDKNYSDNDVFMKQIDGELKPCHIGWNAAGDTAEIRIIENTYDCGDSIELNCDIDLDALREEREHGGLRRTLNAKFDDNDNRGEYWIRNDRIYRYRKQQVIDDENIIIVYQLWSWIEEHQMTRRSPIILYGRCSIAEWFAVDLKNRDIINHAWGAAAEQRFDWYRVLDNIPSRSIWKSIELPDYDYTGVPYQLPGVGTWTPGSTDVMTSIDLRNYLEAGDVVRPATSGFERRFYYMIAEVQSTKIILTTSYQDPAGRVQRIGIYRDFVFRDYLSLSAGRANSQELAWLEGRYYLITGVLFYAGLIDITTISFDFRDKTAGQILREICLLTNSILYVECDSDGKKRIYLVHRGYSGNSVILDRRNLLGMPELTITDHKGDDPPRVDSRIIDNEGFNDVLSRFYADSYYLEKQDIVVLNCDPDVDEHWNIRIFDRIIIHNVIISEKIVRQIVYGKDYLQLTLQSGHDDHLYPNPFD